MTRITRLSIMKVTRTTRYCSTISISHKFSWSYSWSYYLFLL